MVPLTIFCLTAAVMLGLGTGAVFKLVAEWFLGQVGAVTGVVEQPAGWAGSFPAGNEPGEGSHGAYALGFVLMAVVACLCLAVLARIGQELPSAAPPAGNPRQPMSDRRSPILEAHEFFRRGPANEEGWSMLIGRDRDWESSYRDRWSHDKVVRSTHGVNRTGSCSWNVYVKEGIITWRRRPSTIRQPPPTCPTTSRADARAALRFPGTRTRRSGSSTRTSAAACSRCTASCAQGQATRSSPGRRSSRTLSVHGRTSRSAARGLRARFVERGG